MTTDPPSERGAAPGLTADLQASAGVAVVRLRGRLDEPLDPDIRGRIEDLVRRGTTRIVVDCSGLAYLGSRGVSVFIAVLDDLPRIGPGKVDRNMLRDLMSTTAQRAGDR